jgi:hypothetical protein
VCFIYLIITFLQSFAIIADTQEGDEPRCYSTIIVYLSDTHTNINIEKITIVHIITFNYQP